MISHLECNYVMFTLVFYKSWHVVEMILRHCENCVKYVGVEEIAHGRHLSTASLNYEEESRGLFC